jgi:hypothetical protein
MSNYAAGTFETPYGKVHAHNPGSVHEPENLREYNQADGGLVKLQGPALRAFKAAEERATPLRMRRKGKVLPIKITGIGYRDYASQALLYSREPGRFANPDGSLHVEGLAVDIDMNQGVIRREKIKRALKAEGWFYPIAGEPWHASFRLAG